MEIETILNLFDSYWFDLDFFTRKPFKNTNNFPEMPSTSSEIIPATLPTIHTRKNPVEKTLSSSNSTSNNSPANRFDSSFSPNSVLLTPKLQTIFSGKVSEDFEDESKSSEKYKTPEKITTITATSSKNMITSSSPLKGNTGITHNKRRKKKGLSKSLSDLEYEELRGFMDLGFVFSEEDMKDSSLATIIPGLQRLGNKNTPNIDDDNNCNNNINNNNSNVDENKEKVEKMVEKCGEIARPYLSEAWEVMERKRKENELMLKSRVPDPHSQVQMKDYLRSWAHTVASTVR